MTADINLKFPQTGRFIDETGAVVNLVENGSLKTQTKNETAIFEGKAFDFSAYGTIANGQSLTLIGAVDGNKVIFNGMTLDFSSGGVLLEFIESPTISNQGTLQSTHKKNRSLNTSGTLLVYSGATVTGGTVIFVDKKPLVTGVGQRVSASNSGIENGWVLNKYTNYAIRLTNQSGASVDFTGTFGWVEEI